MNKQGRCGAGAYATIVAAQTLLVVLLVVAPPSAWSAAPATSALAVRGSVGNDSSGVPVHVAPQSAVRGAVAACGSTLFLEPPGATPREIALTRDAAKRWTSVVRKNSGKSKHFPRFWLQLPITVSCPDMRRYGGRDTDASGDGGKWLCRLDALRDGCVIYSLGSNGDFSFEREMSASTPCAVHTFDCTVAKDKIPATLPPRVTFHPICLGPKETVDRRGRRFTTLGVLAAELGHTRLDLLKMDIEGAEAGVFAGMLEGLRSGAAAGLVPQQLSVELHSGSRFGKDTTGLDVSLLAIANLGYAVIHAEVNL